MSAASPKIVTKLRALGRLVDALTMQSRHYARACETSNEFRRRLRDRVRHLEQNLASSRLVDLARAYPADHAAALAQARAEIEVLQVQIAESQEEENKLRTEWSIHNEFVGTNSARLDEALAHVGATRDELGIVWGERREQQPEIVQ